jgi:thiamine kinase-like enzyme
MNDAQTMPDAEVQARIQALLGRQPVAFRRIEGGYTPARRWLVDLGEATCFVKVATTPLTATLLRREARAYAAVQGPFTPTLLGWADHPVAPLLIIEDLSKADWPPPWDTARVDQVLAQMEQMHNTHAALPTFQEVHGARGDNWAAVAANPVAFLALGMVTSQWLDQALPTLIEAERRCVVEGDAVTHWDIRSDNLCITGQGVKFIDWAETCLSNPKLDLAFWLPSLAAEGGPLPETILSNEPAIAAWVAGFFAARAGLPVIPDAPHVRTVQQTQLATALPWVVRALALPNPRL